MLIEQQNQFDVRLYAFAKGLFADQLARQDETFRKQLRRFQLLNSQLFGPALGLYWGFRRIPFRTIIKQRIGNWVTPT